MRLITRLLKLKIINVDVQSDLLTKKECEGQLMVIQHEENPLEISVCLPDDIAIAFDPDEFREIAEQIRTFAEDKSIGGLLPQEVQK